MQGDESYVSEELTIVWLLLIVTVVITYFIQRHRLTWVPPSSCAMLLGVMAGGVSRLAGLAQPLRFSPAAFFYALLPPIVFAAGFTLKKRQFFKNFGAILMFAVVGTFISAIVFGVATYLLVLVGIVRRGHLAGSPFVECLMYGSAISSIDPVATLAVLNEVEVPPLLYNLVFGESVLNDAVAIVLFRSLAQFSGASFTLGTLPAVALRFVALALGSLAVGCGTALACAFTLKRFWREGGSTPAHHHQQQQQPAGQHFDPAMYELAIVVMGSYLAYLLAEVVGMSGIVALFFSGICHAHYSYYNVSHEAQVTLRKFFEFASFLCETFVFAYLGMQVVTAQHSWDVGLLLSGIPLCFLSRAANIFPCSYLANLGRTYPIPPNLQRMLWAVGLRGAVAYGLVINLPRADQPGKMGIPAIETATLFIVVVTTLGLGSATGPLLRTFNLEGKDDAELYGLAFEESGLTTGLGNPGRPMNRIEFSEQSALHDRFKEFDAIYLKPLFGGRHGSEHELRGGGGSTARSYASFTDELPGGIMAPTYTRPSAQGGAPYALDDRTPPSARGGGAAIPSPFAGTPRALGAKQLGGGAGSQRWQDGSPQLARHPDGNIPLGQHQGAVQRQGGSDGQEGKQPPPQEVQLLSRQGSGGSEEG
ncbi:hypothetical protein N2152v2_010277 [Parachlorella kessleri]